MKIKLSLIALIAATFLEATSLKEAVAFGLKSDPAILAEISRFEGKEVSVSVAKSGYYPTLDLGLGIGYEKTKRDNPHGAAPVDADETRKEASARFRQPLFEGFKTSSSVDVSTADRDATLYALHTLAENKALEIVKAYLGVIKAKRIITLAETNLETHNEILDSIKQRYKQGVSDKADLIQIKGRVASAKSDLYAAKNNALDAEALYLKVVGEAPTDLERLYADDVIVPETLEASLEKAKKENPTILSARKNVTLVKSQKKGSESNYYPHLYGDLSANYRDDADGIEGTQESYQAMLRMEWNIFNGFKEKHQNEIAQKEVITASQKVNDTERQLVLETTLSWNAYILIQDQLKPLKEHVDYSREAKKLYHEQYNVGRRSLIDVLNSQVEVFNAAKTFVGASSDEIAAKYRLLNSMGTLNETLGINVYNK